MRSERVPATPVFWERLEERLRSEAGRHPRRRLPVSTLALRALRDASSYALHVAMAAGVASVLLLGAPNPVHESPDEATIEAAAVAYVRRFSPAPASPADTARLARELGYEVTVVRTFVRDRAADGKVVAMSHAGTTMSTVSGSGVVRGPMLIVVGNAIGVAGSIAT